MSCRLFDSQVYILGDSVTQDVNQILQLLYAPLARVHPLFNLGRVLPKFFHRRVFFRILQLQVTKVHFAGFVREDLVETSEDLCLLLDLPTVVLNLPLELKNLWDCLHIEVFEVVVEGELVEVLPDLGNLIEVRLFLKHFALFLSHSLDRFKLLPRNVQTYLKSFQFFSHLIHPGIDPLTEV